MVYDVGFAPMSSDVTAEHSIRLNPGFKLNSIQLLSILPSAGFGLPFDLISPVEQSTTMVSDALMTLASSSADVRPVEILCARDMPRPDICC